VLCGTEPEPLLRCAEIARAHTTSLCVLGRTKGVCAGFSHRARYFAAARMMIAGVSRAEDFGAP
jgi:hypothetical protein